MVVNARWSLICVLVFGLLLNLSPTPIAAETFSEANIEQLDETPVDTLTTVGIASADVTPEPPSAEEVTLSQSTSTQVILSDETIDADPTGTTDEDPLLEALIEENQNLIDDSSKLEMVDPTLTEQVTQQASLSTETEAENKEIVELPAVETANQSLESQDICYTL